MMLLKVLVFYVILSLSGVLMLKMAGRIPEKRDRWICVDGRWQEGI